MSLDKQNIDAEALSALMDDELSDFELRRLLSSCTETPELSARWSRFNEAQGLMHNETNVSVSKDFAANVFAAIDEEPTYNQKPLKSQSASLGASVTGFVGKFAIAASVAAAVFIGMQSSLNDSSRPSATPVAQYDSTEVEPTVTLIASGQGSFDAEAQQRLNEYIRSVSIQNVEDAAQAPQFNVLQDSQLIRQVNQIEK